jgi:hypothetical protein
MADGRYFPLLNGVMTAGEEASAFDGRFGKVGSAQSC